MHPMSRHMLPAILAVLSSLFLPAQGVEPLPPIASMVQEVDSGRIKAVVEQLVAFGTRHTLSETESDERGIGAARRWLRDELGRISEESGGRLQVDLDWHEIPPGRRIPEGVRLANVVATLPGEDPERFVIVSGHYDSRASGPLDAESDAPGADDDASGVAVVLEAARVMGHLEPRATVLFMAVAGEEQGLLGARAHARRAREKGHRVEAMITNDIVGGVVGSSGKREPDRVRLFSEGIISGPREKGRVLKKVVGSDNDAPSRQLARYLRRRAQAYVPGFEVTLIFRQDRYLRGGDHRAFNEQGYPGVRFTEVHENYDWQHQDVRVVDGRRYGDLPENLDYEYIRRVAQVNVAGAAELALAPSSPRQVRMIVRSLTPDTELRWAANPEEDLAGYAVLYRRTHEPFWTHSTSVDPGSTRALLKGLSKDDWLFAVQAYDEQGHRSLPVYPVPARR